MVIDKVDVNLEMNVIFLVFLKCVLVQNLINVYNVMKTGN